MPAPDEQQAVYGPAFVHNCMLLIVRAHEAIGSKDLRGAEEPEITGLLVEQAKELAEEEDAEDWLEHLEVIDDQPQNDLPDKLGKRRPRIDIEFVRTGRGRRARFHVEAKRLYRSDSVGEYFGAGGIEMFLSGAYAAQWPWAGMVGYVQSDDKGTWLAALSAGFSTRKNKLSVCDGQPNWKKAKWPDSSVGEVHESCHVRTQEGLGKIEIYHLMLEFQ